MHLALSAILTSLIRADQTHRWEIETVSAGIAGAQSQFHDGGVRTDKKIRQRESPSAATLLVSQKYFSCQKKGLFGDVK